jgi:hypothetical protein
VGLAHLLRGGLVAAVAASALAVAVQAARGDRAVADLGLGVLLCGVALMLLAAAVSGRVFRMWEGHPINDRMHWEFHTRSRDDGVGFPRLSLILLLGGLLNIAGAVGAAILLS